MTATADDVQAELAALALLDRAALAERWAAAFGCPAPRKCGATLLRSALAWHVQMRAEAWPAGTRRARPTRRLASFGRRAVLAPGTRLLRDWQGRTHHVTALARGFEYDGRTYRSLTAIARHITGTAWSGPLFFGLRS